MRFLKPSLYRKLYILIVGTTLCCADLYAQSAVYRISNSDVTVIRLSGTSTLHDWVMNAKILSGEAKFNMKGDTLKSISSFTFSLPVKNLKSDEKAMDKNAYKALKADDNKNILYKLSKANVGAQLNNLVPVRTLGNLSIAGVTKEVTMDVSCQVINIKTIACKGSQKINMTDYQVEPPSFLMGAMKTGDEILLDFNLVFKK